MVSINSKRKIIKIVGQEKAFYRQRIAQSSCARKETVKIDIIKSRNDERKLTKPNRTSSGPSPKIKKRNQFSQFR